MTKKRRDIFMVYILTAALLFFASAIPSPATVNYTYDNGNRLTQADYPDGTTVVYSYDDTGSRTQKVVTDIAAPTGTISINAGAYATNSVNVTLTLTCSDPSGCAEMRFSNDDTNYSTAEAYAATKSWSLESGDGVKGVYAKFKDPAGNWSAAFNDAILLDTAAPSTSASPAGGSYAAAQSVTLSCDDGAGAGCDKTYYTTDGSTPTTASPQYASPLNIAASTTLKFFSADLAGNSETVKTETYTIGESYIRIAGATPVYYATLQAAYDAAASGNTIQMRAVSRTESLNVNRDITVSIEGGYNSDYSSITGMTTLLGSIRTYTGGGTLTIKNFILNTQ
jgi:YD repeat-containing protein